MHSTTAKFAPVAPIQILEEMPQRIAGRYHLLLAHHTTEERERFKNLMVKWANVEARYPTPLTVIMDNSIVELGGAVDDGMILDAIKIIRSADEHYQHLTPIRVVPCLPDVMGDGLGTLELSCKAYDNWMDMGMHLVCSHHSGFMLVTQGSTFQEFADVVNHFLVENTERYRYIRWVGIPRYMLKQWADSRAEAIRYVQTVAPHVRIHLLGFSQNIRDDMLCARLPGVTGIDSAVPVRSAIPLNPTTPEEAIGPRGDWWEKGQLTELAARNIENVRRWINPNLCLSGAL